MVLKNHIFTRLLNSAVSARENACAKYSGFNVGASVISKSGKIYSGCNIESSSYGLSMCAERNALYKALCEGEKEFDFLLVTAESDVPVSPCGACRQVIFDHAPDITVIMTNLKGESKVENIRSLLKYPFSFKK
ncbi:MAG: cytidine deaminase [Candidatus Delongbacteria bacterium]